MTKTNSYDHTIQKVSGQQIREAHQQWDCKRTYIYGKARNMQKFVRTKILFTVGTNSKDTIAALHEISEEGPGRK